MMNQRRLELVTPDVGGERSSWLASPVTANEETASSWRFQVATGHRQQVRALDLAPIVLLANLAIRGQSLDSEREFGHEFAQEAARPREN